MGKSISIYKAAGCVNVVATVIVERDGKFLMVQEIKPEIYGRWNFLSGKAELGETIFEAAEREAKEESGLEVRLTGFVEVAYEMWMDGDGISIRFVFRGEVLDSPASELAKDILAVDWKTPEELQELLKNDQLRNKYTERLAGLAISGKQLPLETVNTFVNDFKMANLTSR